MKERKKILWLVGWYPNKYDPFDGDFIQRHAKAAALYDDIHVLFVKLSTGQTTPEKTVRKGDGLIEEIIYLHEEKTVAGKLKNFLRWYRTNSTEAARVIGQFQPALVHVHIPWRAGLIALWIKKKYNLPYLVTEHWGIYNTYVEDNIYRRPVIVRRYLKKIYQQAKQFISVSRFLGEGVNKTLVAKPYTVIPNVVDTALFYPGNDKYNRFTFLHVSNMVPLKNVEGILKAFKNFTAQTDSSAQLVLIGNREERFVQMAREMQILNQSVFFRGEIPYSEVAAEMRQSHVFVLNSNIENSPCVIGEALCSGLPVIATDVGGIPELVSAVPHILVAPQNDAALQMAMQQQYEHYRQGGVEVIAKEARQRFSYIHVGEKFHKLYH